MEMGSIERPDFAITSTILSILILTHKGVE